MILEVGRLLCRMRLHRWREVKVITGLDLKGVTLTREQFDAFPRSAPARYPWEPPPNILTGVPVYIGDTVQLHIDVTRYRTEQQCRRCDAPRSL